MKFKHEGNLGKVDLLQRHLIFKQSRSEDGLILLNEEEVKEIEDQLSKFSYLLSNVFLNINSLESDQYRGLVSVIKELEPYYKNYKENKSEEDK